MTTIAPSTSMPTASTMENMTMVLSVSPDMERSVKPMRKEVGIERPTMSAERGPRAATTMIMTRRMAVTIEPVRLERMSRTWVDWSLMIV